MYDIDNNRVKEGLKSVNIVIDDIFDLVNSKKRYPKAIPVLVNLLDTVSDFKIKEGIIRSLAVKEAKGHAGKKLIEQYNKISKNNELLLWAIGNTMEVIISEEDVDEVIKIVSNKDNGYSRQMFVLALGKIKSKKVEQKLIELLEDEELLAFTISALDKIKPPHLRNLITPYLNHKDSLVKKEAKKALAKL